MAIPTPRFWVFIVVLLGIWYFYEKNYAVLQSTWEWGTERAHRMSWLVGGAIILYLLFSQRGLVGNIFKSLATIDNDPRLNRVSSIGPPSVSGNHRLPGTRTKYKRSVSALLKKKVAASQSWKCGSCGHMLDETYEVDHIVALDHGGTNEPSNLRALCPHCHRKKTVDERIFF